MIKLVLLRYTYFLVFYVELSEVYIPTGHESIAAEPWSQPQWGKIRPIYPYRSVSYISGFIYRVKNHLPLGIDSKHPSGIPSTVRVTPF
jgi:hypothetical protein